MYNDAWKPTRLHKQRTSVGGIPEGLPPPLKPANLRKGLSHLLRRTLRAQRLREFDPLENESFNWDTYINFNTCSITESRKCLDNR